MKVRLKEDYDVDSYLFEGTVLQDVKELKKHYKGLFCSRMGSYIVKVPKKYCVVVTEE